MAIDVGKCHLNTVELDSRSNVSFIDDVFLESV